jgi:hypothetical protein
MYCNKTCKWDDFFSQMPFKETGIPDTMELLRNNLTFMPEKYNNSIHHENHLGIC